MSVLFARFFFFLCSAFFFHSAKFCSHNSSPSYSMFKKKIINGNELDVPYPNLARHPDAYSRSKTETEQLVLRMNKTVLSKGSGEIRTCSIRFFFVFFFVCWLFWFPHLPRTFFFVTLMWWSFLFFSEEKRERGPTGMKLRMLYFYSLLKRPAAIYGEGEERHIPRIIRMASKGFCLFACGDRSNLVDWFFFFCAL